MNEVSKKQLRTFRNVAILFLRNFHVKDSKIYFAVQKVFKKTTSQDEEYSDEIESIKRDHAITSTDPKDKGRILRDERNAYQYTIDNERKVQHELRVLSNKKLNIDTHFVDKDEIPLDISFEYLGGDGNTYVMSDYDVRSAFEGVVIEEKTD